MARGGGVVSPRTLITTARRLAKSEQGGLTADEWRNLAQLVPALADALERALDALNECARQHGELRLIADKALAALEKIATSPHCEYGPGGRYEMGVSDGHRCAANEARSALAAVSCERNAKTGETT